MGVSFQMQNDNTNKVKKELADRAIVALDAAGAQASSLAKRELQKNPVRIDTGLLRNSITHAVTKTEQPSVLVGTNVEYAIYVHEGTRYMLPNRFIKNAIMNNRLELEKIIQMVLSQ